MNSIAPQEIIVYKGTVWEVRRIRHDDGTWTASTTLISDIPKGAPAARHLHSSELVSSTVQQKPQDWIKKYVDDHILA